MLDEIMKLLKAINRKLDSMAEPDSPWLTLPQGAAYVQMDKQPFRELVYAGKIPSYRRSERRIFVNRADLDDWMHAMPSASVVPEILRRAS